jgi:hypothetical protein
MRTVGILNNRAGRLPGSTSSSLAVFLPLALLVAENLSMQHSLWCQHDATEAATPL